MLLTTSSQTFLRDGRSKDNEEAREGRQIIPKLETLDDN